MPAPIAIRVTAFLAVAIAPIAGATGADPESVVIAVPGSDTEAFYRLRQAGGPLVVQLGKRGHDPIPWELRSRSISGGELLSAVATTRHLHISWLHDGRCAVLYAGAADEVIEHVTEELTATDATTRREGAWRAGSIPDPRIVPLLVQAAADPDLDVAWQATHSLESLGWPAAMLIDASAATMFATAVPSGPGGRVRIGGIDVKWDIGAAMIEAEGEGIASILERMIHHADTRLRTKTAIVLRAWASDASEALLTQALVSPDTALRTIAAIELAHRGHADALDILRTDLDKPDRSAALWPCYLALCDAGVDWNSRQPSNVLTEHGHGAHVGASAVDSEKIFALVDKDTSFWRFTARIGIAYALGWGRESILGMLDKDLADPRPLVRQNAVYGLNWVSSELSMPRLEQAFHDADATVRSAALSAAGSVGGERALAMADEASADPDANVREQVGPTWCALGGDRALAALERLSTAPDAALRRGCASALGHTGDGRAMAMMDRLLADPDRSVRDMTITALATMGGTLAVQRLAMVADDSSAKVRKKTVEYLGWTSGEDVMAILCKALMDPNSGVRRIAVDSLGWRRDGRAVGTLTGRLADPNPDIRRSALQALGHIGDPLTIPAVKSFVSDRDAQTRQAAILAWLLIGGSQFRGALPDMLAAETDPSVIKFLADIINQYYPGDSKLAEAAAAARARIKPPDIPKVQVAPVKGDANDF